MLAQRLFFGALLIAGVVLIAWGDIRLARAAQPAFLGLDLSRGSLIPLAVFLLATFGAIESLRLAAAAGHRPVAGMVLACVACLHAAVTLVPGIPGRGGLQEPVVLIVALGFLAIGCVQVARRRTAGSLGDMASSVLVIIYMGILPAFITTMRTCGPGSRGVWFVVLFVAVVKLTDIGAYFTGLAAGRTKLIPEISPGKTVEGLAGGLAAGCAAAVVLSCTLPWPADVQPGSRLRRHGVAGRSGGRSRRIHAQARRSGQGLRTPHPVLRGNARSP
jgi:phosphatidate cytidylyltransferase